MTVIDHVIERLQQHLAASTPDNRRPF